MPPERGHPIDRSQLPDEFTPETVRRLGFRTARVLADPGNGILSADEQAAFDRALREVMQGSGDRLGRTRRIPTDVDPQLRRSYLRTQQRLEAQAQRARRAFPQLAGDWRPDDPARGDEPRPVDEPTPVEAEAAEPDVSIGAFEDDIEQTSDTLEILEQIAGIQRQQLEHQRSQLLSETRGLFFALAVSVAVIVGGVAPLVEASPHDRRLILLWTAAICAVGGLAYAAVRAVQGRSD